MNQEHGADRLRIDRWLWCVRLFKTRSLAAQAVSGGKVHLNGERVKPAHAVREADVVSLVLGGVQADFDVLGIPERRGPAAEAQQHYREQAASSERRERHREVHRLADQSRPRPVVRPDKRDRRRLLRFQRGEN